MDKYVIIINASFIVPVLSANVTVSGIADISTVTYGSPIIERIEFIPKQIQ
jgi:hypothetical protein